MSAFRKLGPYVVCLVAGIGSGVGVAYFLYIRLNRQIVEIRKLIRELKQEVDIYSDDNRRGKSNKRPRFQYSLTASSGDDDDDFVDCAAGSGLNDDAMTSNRGEPELVGIRQNVELPVTDKNPGEIIIANPTEDQLSPVEEVPDFIENFPLSAETEEKDPDAETEMEDERVP